MTPSPMAISVLRRARKVWRATSQLALVKCKPDPYVLSSNLRARFGREAFVTGVRSIVHRLQDPHENAWVPDPGI